MGAGRGRHARPVTSLLMHRPDGASGRGSRARRYSVKWAAARSAARAAGSAAM